MSGKNSDLLQANAAEAIQVLHTDVRSGLSEAEAESRLKQVGPNEVREKRGNPVLRFAKKFWGLSAWMLELILILSWILGKYSELYVVLALLILNAVLSFAQEQRAAGAVELLRSRLRVTARVLRAGVWRTLAAKDLVPGDIVRVRPGDFVPADVRIIAGEVGVDQSTLTGESMEVEKEQDGLLYAGSVVRRGEATGVVLLTGARTYYGRTTELVQEARPKLHVEEVVSEVVRRLFVIVGVLLAVALLVAYLEGVPLTEMLPLLLVLLLGAVPVALPAMFTVSMAIGSLQLARQGVLVTRLNASDDAATMDVLCVDKTGTITSNRLTVTDVIPLDGALAQDVLLYGALASHEANQDPIDMAFIAAAREQGLSRGGLVRKSFTPFDAKTRCTEALVHTDTGEIRVVKGAVMSVTQACGLALDHCSRLEAQARELAERGQRALAVAVDNADEHLRLIGLVTLSDVPRPDSGRLIAELTSLGVSVRMLTGDALPIAREVARTVGLGHNVIRAAELEKLAGEGLLKACNLAEQSDGFAEIYPEGKYMVVKSLQAGGHVVGMTGDGVNDAPALRQAEVGIAVSNATDVAKGAASVVLTNEGLASIVDLVKNGRRVYHRIATWIINKISRTILKTAFVVFAFVISGRLVMSAFTMLLMMFLTDFVKVSLATDNARWSQEPETWDLHGLVQVAVVLGLLMVAEAFGLLYLGLRYFGLSMDDPTFYTFTFETLFYFAMFSILAVRERRHFWDSMPSRILLTAIGLDLVVGTLIATLGIPGLHPLPLPVTLFVLAYAAVFSLGVNDLAKWLVLKRTGINW